MSNEEKETKEKIAKIKLEEYHSKEYLELLKKTTYKGQKVVFILPNGKEYK